MNYLMAFTLLVSIQKGISINFFQQSPTTFHSTSSSTSTTINNSHQYSNQQHHSTECGIRPARRQPRKEKQQQQQQQQQNQQRQHNNQHNKNKYNNFDYNQNHYNNDQQKYQQQLQHHQQQQQQQQHQHQQKRHHDVNNNFFHNFRIPKIIAGSPTKEGQFPWQASLELLHPSMGFLGHWCGGVLVDEFWVLSASHCVHNDLFNLPLAPLWTVVLGEYDRNTESGYEQRIPVEKIILHQSYQHFLHDLVLMKLTMPADISKYSNVRKICLPFIFNENDQSYGDDNIDDDIIDNDNFNDQHNTMMLTNSFNNQYNHNHHNNHNNNNNNNNNNFISNKGSGNEDQNFFPSLEDFLLSMQGRNKINFTLPSMKELMTTKIANFLKRPIKRPTGRRNSKFPKRRNDKFMTGFKNINIVGSDFKLNDNNDSDDFVKITSSSNGGSVSATIGNENNGGVKVVGTIVSKFNKNYQDEYKDLPYMDCIATGWGKSNMTGDLSDILLKTNVPLQSNSRCKDAYGSFVKIHKGHLCAGKLNGQGGTCVGDSGGPLQCRLTKNGPWILAGITSFGSGCALEGYPDVYTRTSFYMKWIRDIIENE